MTSDQFRALGQALCGETWQSSLSREINVSDRQIRRYAAGTHRVPPGVEADLIELAEGRAEVLRLMANALRQQP